ncbi:MotE family protein [Defluviitalea saccharophila]|uniref:Magnesium transporter MgtE intracellular domain-containing protein n=1 Tax=Defluviitalea saccharophila TaxID=879970 RepID=A0ABZ2Y4E7_9FIRM
MAKLSTKNKEEKNDEIEIHKKKKSKKPFIITSIILLIIIGIGAVVRFNIGNLTEKYLRTYLEKVPIVNNVLLPKKENENPYAAYSKEQLIQSIEELQKELVEKQQLLDMDKDTIEKLESEIARLKEIEAAQIQFKEDKKQFDEMIATQNSADFIKFYKEMYPDTAAEIYERLVGEAKLVQDAKKYAEPFQTMDPENAAKVFEEMVSTDIDLVVLILQNIDSEQRAAILGEMNPTDAAKIVKTMAP